MKAVFLDRDDTLIIDTVDYCVDSEDKIRFFPDTIPALKLLAEHGYAAVIVSNQEVISDGRLSKQAFDSINNKVLEGLGASGIRILKTCVCPHTVVEHCDCRKPKPKLILDAAKEFGITLADSWMIGDRTTDVLTGLHAGTKTILVRTAQVPNEAPDATYTAQNLLEAAEYITTHESATI